MGKYQLKVVRLLRNWGWALGVLVLAIVFVWPFNTTYENLPKMLLNGMAGGRYYIPNTWVDRTRIKVVDGFNGHAADLVFGTVFSYRDMVEADRTCKPTVVYRDPEVCAVRYCGMVFVTTRDLVIRHLVSQDIFLRFQREVLQDARLAVIGRCPPQETNSHDSERSTATEGEDSTGAKE